RIVARGVNCRRDAGRSPSPRRLRLVRVVLAGLESERALHQGARQLVRRIVAVGAAEGVVRADVVAAFEQGRALLHEELRGVEDCAAVVKMEFSVRWLGGDGERELFDGLLPLLRSLVLKSELVVLLTLRRERRRGPREQAESENDRGDSEDGVLRRFHNTHTRGAKSFQTGNAGAIVTLDSVAQADRFCLRRSSRAARPCSRLARSVARRHGGRGISREGSFESVVNARPPFAAYGRKAILPD